MTCTSITLKKLYESVEQLRILVQVIVDDLDERDELSKSARNALRAARATPEKEYVTLE